MKLYLLLLSICPAVLFAADDWGPAQFLIGHWTGDFGGQPGQGTGGFSFAPDVQGKVLVRKSYAEFPAANGKPALRHDDLTVVYREDGQLRATYFDNEDHVIHYTVKPSQDGVVFVTDAPASAPRFRLTYTSTGANTVKIKFEVAPPGKDYATHVEASAHRDK